MGDRRKLQPVMLAVLAAAIAPAPAGAATATATCYDLTGTTADGTPTPNLRAMRGGLAAHNYLRPGTRIYLTGRSFMGRRRFTVHDTGPALADGHFDLWAPGGCAAWGVRTIRYRIGWPRRVIVGRIVGTVVGGPWARP